MALPGTWTAKAAQDLRICSRITIVRPIRERRSEPSPDRESLVEPRSDMKRTGFQHTLCCFVGCVLLGEGAAFGQGDLWPSAKLPPAPLTYNSRGGVVQVQQTIPPIDVEAPRV